VGVAECQEKDNMTKRNPKQEGSNLWDCIPQKGPCPMNCSQCFYNRVSKCPDCKGTGAEMFNVKGSCSTCKGKGLIPAFYAGLEPLIPTLGEVRDGIVRMNCGHDSNFERELVIETAKKYKHYFFNTSIPRFNFPGPVVFTANSKEEEYPFAPERQSGWLDCKDYLDNLMFVRLRVSSTNLDKIEWAIQYWTEYKISIVLTFTAYYEKEKIPGAYIDPNRDGMVVCKSIDSEKDLSNPQLIRCYEWKVRHINSYWCPTKEFMKYVLERMKKIGGRLVTICGTPDSNYCRDCRNCETHFWQTIKHMKEMEK
jgi:hypothetical protein